MNYRRPSDQRQDNERTSMASVPPSNPNRIDPQAPPGVSPTVPEPFVPEPPETEPLAPDVDEPDRCPPETPSPD
jgi:hypothetical protein